MRLVALLAVVAGCRGPDVIPRSQLTDIDDPLPQHGVYARTDGMRGHSAITIDLDARTLTLEVDDIEARLEDWRPPQLPYGTGVFGRYRALVTSASEGAVLLNG